MSWLLGLLGLALGFAIGLLLRREREARALVDRARDEASGLREQALEELSLIHI